MSITDAVVGFIAIVLYMAVCYLPTMGAIFMIFFLIGSAEDKNKW